MNRNQDIEAGDKDIMIADEHNEIYSDEIITNNLNVISSIRIGDKPCENYEGMLSIYNTYIQNTIRVLMGNSWKNTISCVIKTVESARNSRNHNITSLLNENLIKGLNNLIKTYSESDRTETIISGLITKIRK